MTKIWVDKENLEGGRGGELRLLAPGLRLRG